MNAILTNWKTTTLGVLAILMPVLDIVQHVAAGNSTGVSTDVNTILVGLGLVAAKDAA